MDAAYTVTKFDQTISSLPIIGAVWNGFKAENPEIELFLEGATLVAAIGTLAGYQGHLVGVDTGEKHKEVHDSITHQEIGMANLAGVDTPAMNDPVHMSNMTGIAQTPVGQTATSLHHDMHVWNTELQQPMPDVPKIMASGEEVGKAMFENGPTQDYERGHRDIGGDGTHGITSGVNKEGERKRRRNGSRIQRHTVDEMSTKQHRRKEKHHIIGDGNVHNGIHRRPLKQGREYRRTEKIQQRAVYGHEVMPEYRQGEIPFSNTHEGVHRDMTQHVVGHQHNDDGSHRSAVPLGMGHQESRADMRDTTGSSQGGGMVKEAPPHQMPMLLN